MYEGSGTVPDWQAQISGLREAMEEIIFALNEDRRTGVRPDISALEAFDMLDRYLSEVKRDLGI